MVNYDAITLGLEIEFIINDKIVDGIVRYKGGINGKDGVWIGIEAKEPVGYCDGRIYGRVYFKCQDNFGLFLHADEIRLKSYLRRIKKKKLPKPIASECDELLFKSVAPKEYVVCISEDYLKRAKSSFDLSYDDIFSNQQKFISKDVLVYCPKKAIKITEPRRDLTFQRSASIQKTFMPKEEMKLYTKLDWSYKNVKLPKNTDLNNTFDSFNKNRSNYIGTE